MIRVGEAAWLLELDGPSQVLVARHALATQDDAGVLDVVPGARTVLVIARPDAALNEALLAAVERDARAATGVLPPAARTHEVAVRYDGEDLDAVAAHAGTTRAEVVTRHAAVTYRVAFVGFQPGFAYLDGLPAELHVPRRATPRPRIPAGSVAIGGEWTGIYPLATPGGWNLIGRADVTLFAAAADPPAPLQPGDAVRFVPR